MNRLPVKTDCTHVDHNQCDPLPFIIIIMVKGLQLSITYIGTVFCFLSLFYQINPI